VYDTSVAIHWRQCARVGFDWLFAGVRSRR
jgi:hypothetical protein